MFFKLGSINKHSFLIWALDFIDLIGAVSCTEFRSFDWLKLTKPSLATDIKLAIFNFSFLYFLHFHILHDFLLFVLIGSCLLLLLPLHWFFYKLNIMNKLVKIFDIQQCFQVQRLKYIKDVYNILIVWASMRSFNNKIFNIKLYML